MNEPPLNISDDDRYQRLELIGWWDQQRLREARIMVVGAGALGNEVLKNLALVGVGQVTVIDLDRIENSNLSRSVLFRAGDAGQPKATVAASAIREINPDVTVTAIHGDVLADVGLGLVRSMDLVIGCLDNREARLWVNRMCWKTGRPWIDGGIQEINGVAKVFRPPDGACYECGMTDADYRLIQLRYSCPLLRREDLVQGRVPTAPTIAAIIAGLQVQEALKLLHGLSVDEGKAMVFNGVANRFYKTEFQHREDCLSHETWGPVRELPLSHLDRLQDVVEQLAASAMPGHVGQLLLDRDLVTELHCAACNQGQPVMRPRCSVTAGDSVCPQCAGLMVPQMQHVIDVDSPLAELPLVRLGVPDQEILHLTDGGNPVFVQLSPSPPDH